MDLLMEKYILELTEEQAKIAARACEFFTRIRMGQFPEIPYLCLRGEISGRKYCTRRNIAEKYLLDARKLFIQNSMELAIPMVLDNFRTPAELLI